MQFVEKFVGVIRDNSDCLFETTMFDSYEEANDAIINAAAQDLPTETVKAYQINKVYVNKALVP